MKWKTVFLTLVLAKIQFLSIILLSPVNQEYQERNMHRSRTIYSPKQFKQMLLMDGLEQCGLLAVLNSYSDGTHSLQRIHWLEVMKTQTHLHLQWAEDEWIVHYTQIIVKNEWIFIFGWTIPITSLYLTWTAYTGSISRHLDSSWEVLEQTRILGYNDNAYSLVKGQNKCISNPKEPTLLAKL